jgi:hypothetical protein
MTLDQAAYNVLNTLSGGRSENNEYASLEQIKFNIRYYRALLVRRDVERGGRTLEFEQDLGTLPVEVVTVQGEDFSVLRNIPATIRLKEEVGLTWVGDEYGEKAFPIISYREASWQTHNRFTALSPRAYVKNGDLYITNHDAASITLRGLFEDPEEAHDFSIEAGNLGDWWDDATTEFPCPLDVIQQITQSLINGEVKLLKVTEADDTLNNPAS